MIAVIYDILLIIMLSALYLSGKEIKKTCNIKSITVILGILVYTLNVGLRYGRGIDYNLYGQKYEAFTIATDYDYEIGFVIVSKIFLALGIPWQGFVLLLSFIFIFASILFLKNYRVILPYALPLFALFSLSRVENMIRWYLGFSFLLIGLSYYIQGGSNKVIKYIFFCIIACCFHSALVPVCILYIVVYECKTIFMPPIIAILLFYIIGAFFQTNFMLEFVDLFNRYSFLLGDFAGYLDNADYWLAGGFAGAERTVFPGLTMQLLYVVIVFWGYKIVNSMSGIYVYAYNLFLIGYLTLPIARQIELFSRYNAVFYFYVAIVFACIIYKLFVAKSISFHPLVTLFIAFVFLNYGRYVITEPFKGNPDHYLYVWDKDGRTYDDMYKSWIDDLRYSN